MAVHCLVDLNESFAAARSCVQYLLLWGVSVQRGSGYDRRQWRGKRLAFAGTHVEGFPYMLRLIAHFSWSKSSATAVMRMERCNATHVDSAVVFGSR